MTYKTLKRRKIGDRQYEIRDGDTVVAIVTKTGEDGRDTYPWEVLVSEGIELGRRIGPQESLRVAIDEVSARWATRP